MKGVNLRIGSSEIGMESARRYTSERRSVFRYSAFAASGRSDENKGLLSNDTLHQKQEGFKKNAETNRNHKFQQVGAVNLSSVGKYGKDMDKIKEDSIFQLFRLLFGCQMPDSWFQSMRGLTLGENKDDYIVDPQQEVRSNGLYIEKSLEYSYKETENTSFSTTGKVITADGREIEFGLQLEMSRSFEQTYAAKTVFQIAEFIDPLVINLDQNITSVSDQKFFFDLDCDGKQEEISKLNAGCGYLALDKNGDGVINDGNELFGVKTGDGFYELSKYDSDLNGWIDENDEIFSRLQIWTQDQDGNDICYRLQEKGIGAICLHKVATDFSLNDASSNKTNAAIRSTGIFLYENGAAGTVSQLDLAT